MDFDEDDLCVMDQTREWVVRRLAEFMTDEIEGSTDGKEEHCLKTRAWAVLRYAQILASLPVDDCQTAKMPEDLRTRVDALAKKCAPNAHRGSA
jgi:hypothetical protein